VFDARRRIKAPHRPHRRRLRVPRLRTGRRERLDGSQPRASLGVAGVLITRRSAVAERTRLLNQLQALNATAPVMLRERIGEGAGQSSLSGVVSMRARANADIEERAVFGVTRDLGLPSDRLP
jgi:hypothetical protein